MLREARKKAGLSREEAAFQIRIGTRTLWDYETGHSIPPSDVVLMMAKVYNSPELPGRYCAEICPIGQKYAHLLEQKQFAVTVLGLLKELSDVQRAQANLINIAADGRLCEEEIPEFKRIMQTVCELEKQIGELKLVAMRNGIDIDEMMPKEKTAAVTAAR